MPYTSLSSVKSFALKICYVVCSQFRCRLSIVKTQGSTFRSEHKIDVEIVTLNGI